MAQAQATTSGMNRREFLYYIWAASIALYTVGVGGMIGWFAIPRFKAGQFGGKFDILIDNVPPINDKPQDNPDGRFWLVNLDTDQSNERMFFAEGDPGSSIKGIAAVYKVCTHLGCIYAWVDTNNRFECPCHGSKYRLDGRRIASPAPRTLDRFTIEAVDADGIVLAESALVSIEGADTVAPLELPSGTAKIAVNTGSRKNGATQTLICELLETCGT